ncbi:Peptidyl-prolyl cis-trans isomerase CYP19-2 [Platanthera guangdongensis]|uniref:Peptidyl-prolyl cis-trans isomerase CYP19-2 n=1 Tax=Platanthera guangdongensis TaxID=2320717 RepID=A0ABR2MGX3_9ASPA
MVKKNPFVFLDISIGGGIAERLVVELFSDVVPKTAENFRSLCTGEKGSGRSTSKPLHYKGSIIHRIVKGFVAQGGDFTRQDGSGGESIYGRKFPDENFKLKHDGCGFLSMANSGQHTNSSQFFITFKATPHLDGKHVVFGKVVQGIGFLKKIEQAGSESGKPVCPVKIVNCGEVAENKTTTMSMEKGKKTAKSSKDLSDSSDGVKESRKRPVKDKRVSRKKRYSSSDSYSSDDSDSDSSSTSSDSDSDPSSSTSSSSDYRRKRRKKSSKKEKHGSGKRKKEKRSEKQHRKNSKKARRTSRRVSSSDSGSESSDNSRSDTEKPGSEHINRSNHKSPLAETVAKASGEPAVDGKLLVKKKTPEDYVSQEEGELKENGKGQQNNENLGAQFSKPVDHRHISDVKSTGSRGPHKKSGGSPSPKNGRILDGLLDGCTKSPLKESSRQDQLSPKISEPAPNEEKRITKDVPQDGAPQRIRKGRGFTKEYSFARRYRTPSPVRPPVRPYYYRGRNDAGRDAERYGRFRNYRDRSPPRHSRRSPSRSPYSRYRDRRRRSGSDSRSPKRYQGQGRDRSSSPRRSRSPPGGHQPFVSDRLRSRLGVRGTSPSSRRGRSRSKSRSRSPEGGPRANEDRKKARAPSSSRSSSPAGNKGLVSYGDGEP